MKQLRKFLVENALVLTFSALFVLCATGQAITGKRLYNDTQQHYGLRDSKMASYLTTGEFLDGMFENWQAAVLQLAALIVLGEFLRQRGAPHSKRLGAGGKEKLGSAKAKTIGGTPARDSKRGGIWLWRNSLSTVFFGLFAVTFALHVLAGSAAYSREQRLEGLAPPALAGYLGSAKFWFLTMQTWEAEFMAMALYLVLSIFLRQEGSPESKPPNAADSDTGHPNH